MSNIYILEPPTSGKVLLKTSVGDIDVELWAKETPLACKNFIQLCLEGYYDNTTFHRVVRDFIVQGGDPKGDGTGGESIYEGTFKDEFHQRLKFTRRGLLAMANAGQDDNGSQFFFTMGATPELQNKHTIFGKVVGDTLFNMLKLQEGLVEDEKPAYPHKVIKTEVLNNPFSDIIPRIRNVEVKEKKKKEKKPGVKNFKLLSFGEEAEEDEEESVKENEKFVGKGKSTHDVLDDPKLSSKTSDENQEDKLDDDESSDTDREQQLENIKKKLKTSHKKISDLVAASKPNSFLTEEEETEKQQQVDKIKSEIQSVKKEYQKNKLKKDENKVEEQSETSEKSESFKEYKKDFDMYKDKKSAIPKKGAGREAFTLQLLEKFKRKLQEVKERNEPEENEEEIVRPVDNPEEESWMSHQLHFKADNPVLAKDANTKDDDWFEIYDPRNPLNKRRRGESTNKFKK